MTISLPSRSELLRLFHLNEDTGQLIWRVRNDVQQKWNTKHAGKIAGSKNAKGYINVYVSGKICCAHRVVFKIFYDQEPAIVDHRNLDKADNRPSNLRAATVSENGANSRPRRLDMPKGVRQTPAGRFTAFIAKDLVNTYLGTFDDAETASAAYRAAAAGLHGDFARFE